MPAPVHPSGGGCRTRRGSKALTSIPRLCLALAVSLVTLASGAEFGAASPNAKPQVIATTPTLAALVTPVAGDDADVSSLVPVGSSPETYQPTPADIERLHAANVLVANGAGLEAWLEHTIQAAAAPGLIRVTCADGLPRIDDNPHLWMDPELARRYVEKIRNALIAADPGHAPGYRRRAASFDGQLVALARRTRAAIATIPPQHRDMIVFHDAWSYYARRFGLRVLGVVETSPGREPNPADLAALVRLARAHHVTAAFSEPEYSPKLMHTLAAASGIRNVAILYDDSLSTNPQVHDYVAMIDYDTATIVAALR